MDVPEGWKHQYPGDVILKLLKMMYGLKQAGNAILQSNPKGFQFDGALSAERIRCSSS